LKEAGLPPVEIARRIYVQRLRKNRPRAVVYSWRGSTAVPRFRPGWVWPSIPAQGWQTQGKGPNTVSTTAS